MQYRTVIILSSARFNSRKISFIAAARCIMRSTNRAERRAGIAIFDRIGVTETGIKGNRILILHTPLFRPELYRGEIPRSYRTVRRLMHHWTTLHRRRRQSRYSYGRPLAPASLYFYFHVPWINYRGLLSATLRAPVTDSHRLFIQVSRWIVPRYRCPTVYSVKHLRTYTHIHIYTYTYIYTFLSRGYTFLDAMAIQ